MTDRSSQTPQEPHSAAMIVFTAAMSMALAMGIGRFAYTSVLPMMITGQALDLTLGSTLASVNYVGYLIGAMACMVIPDAWSSARLLRWGLVSTVLLTAMMALPDWRLWLVLRFLAGVASAVALIHTARWCLMTLGRLGRPGLGSAMFAGIGGGIAVSGLGAMAMIAAGVGWQAAWSGFAALGLVLTARVWRVAQPGPRAPRTAQTAPPPPAQDGGGLLRLSLFTLAYGLAGFGYIVTATYLPLIARAVLPGSPVLDLFWPIYGGAAALGSILAIRLHGRLSAMSLLILCYLMQGTGVMLATFLPTVSGFAIGSLLAGLPFTALNFYAMAEAHRQQPGRTAQLIGLLTAAFAIGQIVGPPMVELVLHHADDLRQGFDISLRIAGGALYVGALLFALLRSLRTGA
jgi:predicted MFS family arabinose efflux permease